MCVCLSLTNKQQNQPANSSIFLQIKSTITKKKALRRAQKTTTTTTTKF